MRVWILSFHLWLAVFAIAPSTNLQAEVPNVFGEQTQSEAAMMGIFYDLKQTQDRRPTNMTSAKYFEAVDEFLSKGWDEMVLNKYYRASKSVYTTQIFIPSMKAVAAPAAFGAEKTVKPSLWIIHYKAQVSPPESGTYRLVGAADNVIAAAINGKTVLVATLRGDTLHDLPVTHWKSQDPLGRKSANSKLANGDWVPLKAGEPVDLDVIIGEQPGGSFNAFLLVEKQGATYPMDDNHQPILPIFQVAPYATPPARPNAAPLFSNEAKPWKSYQ